jgi:hypothetical protein
VEGFWWLLAPALGVGMGFEVALVATAAGGGGAGWDATKVRTPAERGGGGDGVGWGQVAQVLGLGVAVQQVGARVIMWQTAVPLHTLVLER